MTDLLGMKAEEFTDAKRNYIQRNFLDVLIDGKSIDTRIGEWCDEIVKKAEDIFDLQYCQIMYTGWDIKKQQLVFGLDGHIFHRSVWGDCGEDECVSVLIWACPETYQCEDTDYSSGYIYDGYGFFNKKFDKDRNFVHLILK